MPIRVTRAHTLGRGVHLEPTRGLELLVEQPLGDAQLARAVLQKLAVLEVATQPHRPENRLLQLEVQHVVFAVDAHARKLVVDAASCGLQPEDVLLVALHEREQALQADGGLALARHPRLHHREFAHVHRLHCTAPGAVQILQSAIYFFRWFLSTHSKLKLRFVICVFFNRGRYH